MGKEKSKQGLLKDAHEFLKEQDLVVLSTVAEDGQPQAATVFYYLKDDASFTFYFFTHDQTEKFKNLDKNNKVALTVFTEVDPVVVQAKGIAWLVEDAEEAMQATSKLTDIAAHSSYWYDPPVSKIQAGKLEVLRVEVNWLRYADFRDATKSSSPFHQIIP